MEPPAVTRGIAIALAVLLLTGCRAEDGLRPPSRGSANDGLRIDRLAIARGVLDGDRDPFVLALEVAGLGVCAAALLEENLVLTARRCVAQLPEEAGGCPGGARVRGDRFAGSLAFYAGDDAARGALVALGREVLVPEGDALCGADIALVILDRRVEGIVPRPARRRGATTGDHVRTVSFGLLEPEATSTVRLLREHVEVVGSDRAEFLVAEGTCQGEAGGVAIDEATGELIGVAARSDGACPSEPERAPRQVYTRLDAHRALVEEAIARSKAPPPRTLATRNELELEHPEDDVVILDPPVESVAARPKTTVTKPQKSKPSTDVGESCERAEDCATAVCVHHASLSYCSRGGGGADRGPTQQRGLSASGGARACVRSQEP